MKQQNYLKTLATLVSAGALAAPMAVLADDAPEPPEVYGFVNLSVDYEGYKGGPGSDDGNIGMNTGSSHFGFRGEEELDGGLKTIYQAEVGWTYTGDNNGTPAGGPTDEITQVRDSFVGLAGDFGRLTLGRQSFGNQFVYDGPGADWVAQVGTPGGVLSINPNLGSRLNNVIRYSGLDVGPMATEFSLVPGGMKNGAPEDHAYNARFTLDQGPLSSAFTLWQITNADGRNDVTLYSLAGRYAMDALTLSAQVSGVNTDANNASDTGISFGAMMPMGETARVKGIVSQFMAEADDSNYTTIAAGYDRILSDRTELRFAFASTRNDEFSSATPHAYGVYGPSSGVTPDTDETHTTVSANLRHSF